MRAAIAVVRGRPADARPMLLEAAGRRDPGAHEMRLFPLEEVVAGWLIRSWEESHRVLSAWSAWTETAPDAVTSVARLLQPPPIPQIPEPLRGRNLVVVEVAILADEADPTSTSPSAPPHR